MSNTTSNGKQKTTARTKRSAKRHRGSAKRKAAPRTRVNYPLVAEALMTSAYMTRENVPLMSNRDYYKTLNSMAQEIVDARHQAQAEAGAKEQRMRDFFEFLLGEGALSAEDRAQILKFKRVVKPAMHNGLRKPYETWELTSKAAHTLFDKLAYKYD
jgi:hypothetical protein